MTNAELAILSLIAEAPRHGYDLETLIEARGMRAWTEIGFSSIYYLLKKLETKGLVRGRKTEGPGRGPARKVFTITDSGRSAYEAAVLTALATPFQCRPALQLGLANLPGVAPADALAALRAHRDGLTTNQAAVAARRAAQQPLPDFVDAMFDHSLTMLAAEAAWLATFIHKWEQRHDQS